MVSLLAVVYSAALSVCSIPAAEHVIRSNPMTAAQCQAALASIKATPLDMPGRRIVLQCQSGRWA